MPREPGKKQKNGGGRGGGGGLYCCCVACCLDVRPFLLPSTGFSIKPPKVQLLAGEKAIESECGKTHKERALVCWGLWANGAHGHSD